MQKVDFDYLYNQCPKGWNDFSNYYKENYQTTDFLKDVSFEKIPFDMQIGVYLSYFNENGVELDICNIDYTLLPDLIKDTFTDYENVISHYS